MTQAPARLERLRHELQALGLHAAVVSDPRHVYYLTGYHPLPNRPAYLVVAAGEVARLVAPRGAACDGVEVVPYLGYSIHEVFPALARSLEALAGALPQAEPLGVERESVSLAALEAVGSPQTVDIGSVLRRMRLCKWPDEVALIRRCALLTDAGYQAAAEAIRAGGDELEVYLATRTAIEREAGEVTPFDGDFVSGERTLQHGGPPTCRRPRPGDTFIIDLFPTYRGYWADTCRTLAVSRPTPAQEALAERVLAALEAGRRAIRPGLRADELYHLVKETLGHAGDNTSFSHHGGHAVGLWPHESPMIIPADHTPLAEGMVITLEPGLYLPDVGGVRFEDDYLVTADGCETLSRFPKVLAP